MEEYMMKKISACILIAALMVLSMTGCKKDEALKILDRDHAVQVREDLKVFSDGDISAITERVFGQTSEKGSGDGIIADLFANADVEITSVDESSISYTIVSPDISDFFAVCADQLDAITTSEELGEAILKYAETAPEKEYTVTLLYVVEDGKIDISYDNADFINAMTGGLVEAYADLYDQYLEEMG